MKHGHATIFFNQVVFLPLFFLQANLTTCFSGLCAVADFADESEQTGAFASLEGHAYRGPDAAPEDLQGEKQILTMRTRTNQQFRRCASKIQQCHLSSVNPKTNGEHYFGNFGTKCSEIKKVCLTR